MRKMYVALIASMLLISSHAWAESVILTWEDMSTNETGFHCERQTGGGSFSQTCEVGANVHTWIDTAVTPGVPHCYKVRAYNSAGQSAYSNTACITLSAQAPGAPQNLMCTVAPGTPPLTGLVLAMSFNAGTGTTVADTSGSNNTGAISGATWTTAGKYGGALSFDGVNDMVSVPDSASLDLTTGMTLSAWVHPTLASDWPTIMFKERTGNLVYSLYASDGSGLPSAIMYVGTTKQYLDGPTALPLNTWSHLAATYDGVQYRMYVNGMQVMNRAQTGPIVTSTGALRIGGNNIWGEYFQGVLDDVRIYNRALTQPQIQLDMVTPIP